MDDYDEEHEKLKKDPQNWYDKAVCLLGAAATVVDGIDRDLGKYICDQYHVHNRYNNKTIDVFSVYLMLCGMSIELLLKAIVVQKGNVPKTTHSLIELAKDADFELNDCEKKIFKLFENYIVWFGRYPVPTDNNKNKHEKLSGLINDVLYNTEQSGHSSISRWNDALSWEPYKALWDKIDSVFEERGGH